MGWLRRNDRKVMCRNQGYPYAEMVRCMEVRAFIVAMKSRNGDGAKGGRKIDGRNPDTVKGRLAIVKKQKPKQAREANDRWSRVERCVWTDSMLTALDKGVKGGKWLLAECLFSGIRASHHNRSSSIPLSIVATLLTGEPDAGDLHVRFGGRGRDNHSLPTPIIYFTCSEKFVINRD